MNEIILANAALTLVEELVPRIESLVKSGQITPEQQQTVRDRYTQLRDNLDARFSGPEWQIEK